VWAGERADKGLALLARKAERVLIRKALPGDPDDNASRYIEAAGDGVRFACKLAWFDRLIAHARTLKKFRAPVVLLGGGQRGSKKRRHLSDDFL
jgi:exodeoxyribonuclease III